MSEYVTVQMVIEKTMADELNKKGIAEIVFRQASAKYKNFVKCKILDNPTVSNEVAERIHSSSLQVLSQDVKNLKDTRAVVLSYEKNIKHGIKALTTITKKVTTQLDLVYRESKAIKNLSYIGVGLSLTNIAVDMAGFTIVINKLNDLNSRLQGLSDQIGSIANIQKNDKIAECQRLIMRFNSLADKIKDEEDVSLDDIEALIVDMKAYLSEMIHNLSDKALKTELVLEIINVLLPAYTILYKALLDKFYLEKGKLPANTEIFNQLYDELENSQIREQLKEYFYDHYFIEEKMRSEDVFDIINAQILIELNGRAQIDDEITLIKLLETREGLRKYKERLEELVQTLAKENLSAIAEDSGVDEETCSQFFGLTQAQAI